MLGEDGRLNSRVVRLVKNKIAPELEVLWLNRIKLDPVNRILNSISQSPDHDGAVLLQNSIAEEDSPRIAEILEVFDKK